MLPVTNRQASPKSRPVETQHNSSNLAEHPGFAFDLVCIGMRMVTMDDEDEIEGTICSAPSQPSDEGRHPEPNVPLSNTHRAPSPERSQPENSRNPQEGIRGPVSFATIPRKAPLEEMLNLPLESPPPYSSPIKNVQTEESGYFQAVVPSQPLSTSTQQLGGSLAHSESVPRHANAQAAFIPMQAPSRALSVQNNLPFRSDVLEAIPLLEIVQNALVLRTTAASIPLFLVNRLHHVALAHRHLVLFRNVLSCPLLLPNPA
jgi:hypothetical protein